VTDRPTIDVSTPLRGWGKPWPSVAEIEAILPHEKWTLVGGLMVQLHSIHRGIDALRPTRDIDMVLHIETKRGLATETARALESLGYELTLSIDGRTKTAHRFKRGDDVVDVLIADHISPGAVASLRGKSMVAVAGGTQALRRTMNARLEITAGTTTTISIPSAFGALILKAAAYVSDSRDKERHLQDAVVLLAAIDDPFAAREGFAGSDRKRVRALVRVLSDDARPWRLLPAEWRTNGQAALRILSA
jgi:predicted nucleotidyltransferase